MPRDSVDSTGLEGPFGRSGPCPDIDAVERRATGCAKGEVRRGDGVGRSHERPGGPGGPWTLLRLRCLDPRLDREG